MNYIDNAAVELRLGTTALTQLTDDSGVGAINASVVDEARLGAEGEVNSYLARRYLTPIDVATHSEVAGVLASVTLDIAEYRLHARRPPIPDAVMQRFRAALGWLSKVAAGGVSLPSVAPIASPVSSGLVSGSTGDEVALTREELEGL